MKLRMINLRRFYCLLILLFVSTSCFAAPRKDADGHYMVKSITRIYNKKSGVYEFTYNALNEIVKVEYSRFDSKYRRVLSRYGNKITYKKYNDDGRQDPETKYDYVLDDEGQIMFVSDNSLHGGSQLKIQNDYYYEDGRLVYGEQHEYHADNLTDDPHLFLDTFHSMNYDCTDGNIEAMLTQNNYLRHNDTWWQSKPCPLKDDIEYWLIDNNTNIEPSSLYFTYSPYEIAGNYLAFLTGWMKLRSQHLVGKYGTKSYRTRIEYRLDEYNRPIEAKSVPDTEFAKFADRCTVYRIEYVDD